MSAFDTTLLDLQYRPDLGTLTARWLRDAPVAEVQAAHHALLQFALAHGSHCWLMDRRRLHPHADLAQWVAQHWLPAAAEQLAHPLRLASLVSPELWHLISTQTGLREATQHVLTARQPYLVQVFTDEGEAVRWLTQGAALPPAHTAASALVPTPEAPE